MPSPLRYLAAYPLELQQQVRRLLDSDQLADHLRRRYPTPHTITDSKALRAYALALKERYLKNAAPLSKVIYDGTLLRAEQALGLHTQVSRVQGARLKRKNEIRISTLFQRAPEELLAMILVHELAHLKEKEHNKRFYQLCTHMLPDYHQRELDARLYLIQLEAAGPLY